MKKIIGNNTTLFFNTRDELIKVPLDKVMYFESDANYSHVRFKNGAKAILLTSLLNIEKILNEQVKGEEAYFIRIGKKLIVNSRYIFSINIQRQKLILTDFDSPEIFELTVSKEALKNIKQLYTDKEQWKSL